MNQLIKYQDRLSHFRFFLAMNSLEASNTYSLFVGGHGLLEGSRVLGHGEEMREVRVAQNRPRGPVSGIELNGLKELVHRWKVF